MPSKYTQIWSFQDLAEAIAQEEEEHGIKIEVRVTVGSSPGTIVYALHIFDVEGFTEMGSVYQHVLRNGKDASRMLGDITLAVRAMETHWRSNPWNAPKKLRRRLSEATEDRLPYAKIPLPRF